MGGAPSMPAVPAAAPPPPAPVIANAQQSSVAGQARMRAAAAAGSEGAYGGTVQNAGGAMGLASAPGATKSLLG